MTSTLSLHPPQPIGDSLELSATLTLRNTPHRLWWRIPASWSRAATDWADPFLIGFIFQIMESGDDVFIEGKTSPSLLANLELFMAMWSTWVPGKYKIAAIRATEEIERTSPDSPDSWIIPFSSGIDSCFTLFRHHQRLLGRRNKIIGAALIIDGFDIISSDLNPETKYSEILARANRMTETLSLPCIPVSTNFRELPTLWEHSHASQLASALTLFSGQFSGALIPNSVAYTELNILWGSNPLSDPRFGSLHFPILDDGADAAREDKCELLTRWPAALQNVKVCFGVQGNTDNCCVCEKCLRTILAFRIAGAGLPPAFKHDVSDAQIRAVRIRQDISFSYWQKLSRTAIKKNLDQTSWAKTIAWVITHELRRRRFARIKNKFIPLRNAIRRLFRHPVKKSTASH